MTVFEMVRQSRAQVARQPHIIRACRGDTARRRPDGDARMPHDFLVLFQDLTRNVLQVLTDKRCSFGHSYSSSSKARARIAGVSAGLPLCLSQPRFELLVVDFSYQIGRTVHFTRNSRTVFSRFSAPLAFDDILDAAGFGIGQELCHYRLGNPRPALL